MRYPKRHSTYGRVKLKTIQLFLGKYSVLKMVTTVILVMVKMEFWIGHRLTIYK